MMIESDEHLGARMTEIVCLCGKSTYESAEYSVQIAMIDQTWWLMNKLDGKPRLLCTFHALLVAVWLHLDSEAGDIVGMGVESLDELSMVVSIE